MTTELISTPAAPAPSDPARPGGGSWRVSWAGLRTVALLELRQRVRSTRWIVILAVWAGALVLLTWLITHAVHSVLDPVPVPGSEQAAGQPGPVVFGIIIFLVLSLGGLIAPALTATSINGDRTAGVLATLQTTLLSPAELALGKLMAAWATALALLSAAAPCILWAYLDGGTPIGRLLVTLALLAVTLLVVCAVALGWSAIAARASSSAVLTYLTVAFLGLGLPLLFALSLPLVQQTDRVVVQQMSQASSTDPGTGTAAPDQLSGGSLTCVQTTESVTRAHTERIWWLLAASPYVVVADAAPRRQSRVNGDSDPLTAIRDGVRSARLGPAGTESWCGTNDPLTQQRESQAAALPSSWPYGLAADLLLGAGAVVIAVRRLRAPATRLPRGTRVA